MAQGLSSGRGAAAYMPQGLAGMMAIGEKREQEAKAQALSEAAKNAGMSPTEQALFESMDLGGKQGFLSQLMAERRARANRVGRAPSEAERASSYLASLGASTGAQPQGGGLSMGMPASASAPVASAGGLSFGSAVDAGQQPPGMPLGTSISSAMAPQAPSGGLTPQTLGFSPGIAERAQAAPSGPPAGRSADELMRLRGTLQQRLMAVTQAAMSGNPDALAAQGVLAKQLQVIDSMMPQQPDMTEADREIARLESINMSREEAIKLKEGVYKVITDPVTKESILFDVQTRRVVRPMEEPQQQPAQPPAAQPQDGLTFGDQFQNAGQAFGLGGAARGAANTLADATLGITPFPETRQAQSDFAVFGEGLVNSFASAYGRQPPSWLLKNIEKLTPEPGVLEGPGAAQDKLRSLARELESRRTAIERSASRRLDPTTRTDLEGQVAGIDATLAQIYNALGGFQQQQLAPEVEERLRAYE